MSTYASVGEWMDNALNPDFFVSASANLVARSITFPREVGALIEHVPGVDQVQLVRNARVMYRQAPVMVLAIEAEKIAKTGHRVPVAGLADEMNRLAAEGKGMIASDSFATIHSLHMGNIVELPTHSGVLKLPIAGIVRDYSDMQGSVFIDRSVYTEWWKDDTVNVARVYVKKGEDVGVVRQRVIDALAGQRRLLVLTNREVRAWIMKLLDQWFALTYNQIAVAILVEPVRSIVRTVSASVLLIRVPLPVRIAALIGILHLLAEPARQFASGQHAVPVQIQTLETALRALPFVLADDSVAVQVLRREVLVLALCRGQRSCQKRQSDD